MKVVIRIPVAPVGVIVHKPKKGKNSYTRNAKHRKREETPRVSGIAF